MKSTNAPAWTRWSPTASGGSSASRRRTRCTDIRWGRPYRGPGKDADGKDASLDSYVWVFEISGGAPPAHFVGGWSGTHSYRQPPMYFRLGGGTCSGVSKPGHLVWSRVFVANGALNIDLGLGHAVGLPEAETQDRLNQTTAVWPIMHAVLLGVSRDQMMGPPRVEPHSGGIRPHRRRRETCLGRQSRCDGGAGRRRHALRRVLRRDYHHIRPTSRNIGMADAPACAWLAVHSFLCEVSKDEIDDGLPDRRDLIQLLTSRRHALQKFAARERRAAASRGPTSGNKSSISFDAAFSQTTDSGRVAGIVLMLN